MTDDNVQPSEASPFMQVPVEITVAVGQARPLLKDLLTMSRDSILTLDRKVDDPVELYAGNKLIARGELTELSGEQEGLLAVRLTEVVSLQGGL